jgi:hypothetical protein
MPITHSIPSPPHVFVHAGFIQKALQPLHLLSKSDSNFNRRQQSQSSFVDLLFHTDNNNSTNSKHQQQQQQQQLHRQQQ